LQAVDFIFHTVEVVVTSGVAKPVHVKKSIQLLSEVVRLAWNEVVNERKEVLDSLLYQAMQSFDWNHDDLFRPMVNLLMQQLKRASSTKTLISMMFSHLSAQRKSEFTDLILRGLFSFASTQDPVAKQISQTLQILIKESTSSPERHHILSNKILEAACNTQNLEHSKRSALVTLLGSIISTDPNQNDKLLLEICDRLHTEAMRYDGDSETFKLWVLLFQELSKVGLMKFQESLIEKVVQFPSKLEAEFAIIRAMNVPDFREHLYSSILNDFFDVEKPNQQ